MSAPGPEEKGTGTAYRPLVVAELETTTGELTVRSGDPAVDEEALLLVREHGRPVGLRRVPTAELAERSAPDTVDGPRRTAPPGDTDSPEVAVVICTLGTHPMLPEAVRAVLAQTHRALRVIVVDNDPDSGATRAALADVEDPRLLVVAQPERGLSRARNRGVQEVHEPFVAFTDDDAVADPDWLAGLLRVMVHDPGEEVHVVTGLVVPAEQRSAAQEWFEDYGGFGKGFSPLWWAADPGREVDPALGTPGPRGPLFPVTTGKVGSGNSMLFRRAALAAVGGFDPALGAGTITTGGEDLDVFARLLMAGGIAAYTPDAVVWHHHRTTYDGLRSQIFGCGAGMGAVIVKHLVRDPALVAQVAGAVLPLARARLGRGSDRDAGHGSTYPRQLVRDEVRGLVAAPALYARSRLAARRSRPRRQRGGRRR